MFRGNSYHHNKKKMSTGQIAALICVLAIGSLMGYAGIRILRGIQFNRNCEGYLKRAADANTVERATRELEVAIAYLERNRMTEGFTSVIYTTPDEDVGFWYGNLQDSLRELREITETSTPLERSNMLMKLRETLIDKGEGGSEKVTAPSGISVFPHNTTFAWWGILSLVVAAGAALTALVSSD